MATNVYVVWERRSGSFLGGAQPLRFSSSAEAQDFAGISATPKPNNPTQKFSGQTKEAPIFDVVGPLSTT